MPWRYCLHSIQRTRNSYSKIRLYKFLQTSETIILNWTWLMGEKFPRFSLVTKYIFIFHIADIKYHKFVCVLLRPSCVSLFPTWLLWTMVWASCLSSTHLLLSPMHLLINLCTLRWERKPSFFLAISHPFNSDLRLNFILLFCPRMPWLLEAAPTSTAWTLCPTVISIF